MKIKNLLSMLKDFNPEDQLTIWLKGERLTLEGVDASFVEQGFIELNLDKEVGHMSESFNQILKYQDIIKSGKKAELHFEIKTGYIRCITTVSATGAIGNGSPPAPWGGWIVVC